MAEQRTATCPQCSRTISAHDTIIFGHGRLGHVECRRPRVLSAEERTILSIYCRDHPVAECVRCAGWKALRADRPWCGVLARDAGGAFKDGARMLIEAIKLDRRRVWLVTGKSL